MTADSAASIGPALSSDLFRLALAYNDALDRCTTSGGANIDEVMAFFADDAERITVASGRPVSVETGKAAIREQFLRRAQQVVEVQAMELWGDFIVCRLLRRDATFTLAGTSHNLRILLVKEGKIRQLLVIVDPEELGQLRGGQPVVVAPTS